MAKFDASNPAQLEVLLDEYLLQQENLDEVNSNVFKHLLEIIDELASKDIMRLCKPLFLLHRFFAKLRVICHLQLNLQRRGFTFSEDACQLAYKSSNLFLTMSKHVTDTNKRAFRALLVDKALVVELCSCLNDAVYYKQVSNVPLVSHLILSLYNIQCNHVNLLNDSILKELIDAVGNYIILFWHENQDFLQIDTEQKKLFNICLDLFLSCASDQNYRMMARELLALFSNWFHQQTMSLPSFLSDEQNILINSKLLTILTSSIWKLHKQLDEFQIVRYTTIIESLIHIILNQSDQLDQYHTNLSFDISCQHLNQLTYNSHLLNIIKENNICEIIFELIRSERYSLTWSTCSLMLTISTEEIFSRIGVKKFVTALLELWSMNDEISKNSYSLIDSLTRLQECLHNTTVREEFINQSGISWVMQFATDYNKVPFNVRSAALKVLRCYRSYCGDILDDDIDVLPEMMLGSNQTWMLSHWKCEYWNNTDDKTSSSVTATIPLHNFDPMLLVEAFHKHNKLIDDKELKCAMQRNREDTVLLWIYDKQDEGTMKDIIEHLRSIFNTIRVYSDTQYSVAIKFITENRTERIVVLLHDSVQKRIVRHIQHATHVSSIIVYDSSSPVLNQLIHAQEAELVFYNSDLPHSIDLLAEIVELSTNYSFWFYESKQMLSADLTVESAGFFWQFFLTDILNNMSPIDTSELINLAIQWYKNNPLILCEIEQFRKQYNTRTAELWLNSKPTSFIQRMLQQSFKNSDMQIIYAARFFIIDIMKNIETRNSCQHRTCQVFLGDLMSVKRVEFLREHQDTILMPKGFLIGHIDRLVTIYNLLCRPRYKKSNCAVLFDIDIDDKCSIRVLANDYVIFGLTVSFRIINIDYNQLLDIYMIHLQSMGNGEQLEELWQTHIEMRKESGECIDTSILFGALLADMNNVPAAMDYYSYQFPECLSDSLMAAHRFAAMGRISLRCYFNTKAIEYYTQALTLYEIFLPATDAHFIRLQLDLIISYIINDEDEPPINILERFHNFLTVENQNLFPEILQYFTQGLQNFFQILYSDIRTIDHGFVEAYFADYKQREYFCTHPVLIGGLAIQAGDIAKQRRYLKISVSCYEFAFKIGERNLPLCHPMILISLVRQIEILLKLSITKTSMLAIQEFEQLPALEQELFDISNEDNIIIANTMRDIGFQYVKYGMSDKAKFYLERCIPIYRRQLIVDEVSLHRCQAYLAKEELSLNNLILTPKEGINIHELQLSAIYEMNHILDPDEDEELYDLWNKAMNDYHRRLEGESNVVRKTIVIWIDAGKEKRTQVDNNLLQTLSSNPKIDLHIFDDVESSIYYLTGKDFVHVQVAIHNSCADTFFAMQEIAQLQTVTGITMCVFVFGINHDDVLYEKYSGYLQCFRKCWTKMLEMAERCLIISNDHILLQRFCTLKDTLGMTIAQIIFLADVKAFGNIFDDESDPLEHEINLDSSSNENKTDFVGYMSGFSVSKPKLFQHLRFAKAIGLPKNDSQLAAVILFCRRHGISTEHIALICHHISPGCCIRSKTLAKYFVRLWTLESPPFYKYINQALSECNVEDIHLLRFFLYDYFEMFLDHALPYHCGMLYRGIHTTQEQMISLMDHVGKRIYFVCFTSTSKNRARAMVGGNLVFEIQTLSEEQQRTCRVQSNIDVSSLTAFPEEEEVIYAPLTTFLLLSVTYNVQEDGSMDCIVRIREEGSSIFTKLLLDKQRLPNRTPFQSGTDMWATKNDDFIVDVVEKMKSLI